MDYLDERGTNPIQDWLHDVKQVPRKGKAKIDRLLLQLAGTELWVRPGASNLDDYPGIVEIRILWMNVQYRLLGFRGPGPRQFTLLEHAIEKDDKFVPPSAPSTATTRMSEVLAENPPIGKPRRRICEHRFS
jgi:hypothetical protein